MPVKGKTKRPQHVIDQAVKRFMGGEQAVALAKEYKISRPGFYLWVRKHKEQLLEESKKANMTPADREKSDKKVLSIEIDELRNENRKLREKVISMMIKLGEI